MNRSKSMRNASFFAVFLFCFSGASQVLAEPNKQDTITVKSLSNTLDTRIINTSARREGEVIVLEGVVRRTKETKVSLPVGCIDVGVHDEQGKLTEKAFVQIPSTGSYTGGAVENRFIARIPVMVTTGAYVDVKYHNGPHQG